LKKQEEQISSWQSFVSWIDKMKTKASLGKKIFEGIKVVEFAWVYVGPATSKYLADHGATVIKVESHKRPENLRVMPPFAEGKPGINRSMFFGRTNSNKYSTSLDLKHPKGKELAWKLIKWADIVTESFAPGVMEKLGLDYDSVKKVKPDVIYFSTSMQGQSGPHASYRGFGSLPAAFGGFLGLSGWPGQKPLAPHGAYIDYLSARFSSTALIAALEYHRKTGKGQWIEQSQFETSLHFLSPLLLDYGVNGRIVERSGNRLAYAAPHGVYRCKGNDRWVAIAVFTDNQWKSFCKIIDKKNDFYKQSKFSTLLERKKNEDELDRLIEQWTVNYTDKQAEEIMQEAGIPAHMVAKSSDVLNDSQLKHRGYFKRLNHREMGKPAYENQACYILSEAPREQTLPSPCLGEHNEYVYKELLGMTDEEITEHINEGSITTQLPE